MDKYYTDKLTTKHKTRQKQKRPDKLTNTHYMDQNGATFPKHWSKHGCEMFYKGSIYYNTKKQNYTRKETSTKTGTHVAMVIKYLQ